MSRSNGARPELGTTRVAEQAGRRGDHGAGDTTTPYRRPVIKEPVWTWEIPCYFWSGGLAGSAAGLAILAELRGDEPVARRALDVALAGAVVSPVLLISDLGRPERFLHMLRMFKVTSPMSVGSWILAGFGAATGLGWAAQRLLADGGGAAGRAARAAAGVLGLPLTSYTAALIANTAVPAWHDTRRLLPFVFASGGALSAGGAVLALLPPEQAAAARRLAIGGAIAELVTKEAMERRLGEPVKGAYQEGPAHDVSRIGKPSVAAGAALALAGRRSRRASIAAGVLLNVGALVARLSVFKAGQQSAGEPDHTVVPQRERVDAGTELGASTRSAASSGARGTPGRSDAVRAGRPASEIESP